MPFKGPYPTVFTGNTSAMVISATTFSGGVTNAGTIGSGGVNITSSTFQTGGFLNTNLISGTATGIAVGSNSTINGSIVDRGTISANKDGILVNGGVVSGGIQVGSAGTISAPAFGFSAIVVKNTPTFGGGISNAGLISAAENGIFVSSVGVFGNGSAGGGITNTGTIAALLSGIDVNRGVTSFSGGINNLGVISGGGQRHPHGR